MIGILWRVILVVCLVAGGGFASYQGGKMISNGYQSRNWPAVQGRVVQSSVDTHTVTKTSNNKRRTTTEYRATIRYEYAVNGVTYTNDRITVERTGYSGKNRGAAENSARAYPSGSSVTVHYDPRNPATAVLQTGAAGPASWILPALGPIFLVVALFIALRRSPLRLSGRLPLRGPSPVPEPSFR
jgi:hypothetical protein